MIAVDGLRASALGAYGATAHTTPAFDAFAAESTLGEWRYADTADFDTLYTRLAPATHAAVGAETLLVSDQPLPPAVGAAFDERVSLEAPPASDVAASVAETTQAAVWEGFAAALADRVDADRPLFAWLHTRGLYGPWDAPASTYEPLLDEDDPEVAPSVRPAEGAFDDPGSAEACEARFAAACRYAGQIATLDACFGGWLDIVGGLLEGQETRIVLLGLRGYPLGEHGRVGGVDGRGLSEQHHVPLLVCDGDPATRFGRDASLASLASALGAAARGEPLVADSPVVLRGAAADAIITADWMLRAPHDDSPPALYAKPDDRWEQNDVASIEPGVTDDLLALLAGGRAAPESGIGPLGASK